VKDIGELTVGFVGRNVKLVERGSEATTGIVWALVEVCVGVEESVAVSVMVYDWRPVNVCVMEAPVPVAPSPKFQLIVYGEAPPVVVEVKVTGRFTIGVLGEIVKVVDSAGGVIVPKNSVIGLAFASFEVSELKPQTTSRVLRIE